MDLKNKIILFEGDSITDMARKESTWDMNHIYGHSYVFLLASFFGCERPKDNIKVYNRGVGGDSSYSVKARLENDVVALQPDIVSVLAGINDIIYTIENQGGINAVEYGAALQSMIETTHKELPNATFVVCEPFGFSGSAQEKYKDKFKELIPKHAAQAKEVAEKLGCIFVPLQGEFDHAYHENASLGYDYWLWDGIHPTAAGQRIIAKKWLKTVENALVK